MAFDRAVINTDGPMEFFGGTASAAISGGQFVVAGSNTLAGAVGSTTGAFNYTKIDLAPGGSNNTVPVGYAIGIFASGVQASYIRGGVVTAPCDVAVAAGDHLQAAGEATFRAVRPSITASGIIGTALNSAASGNGVWVQLNL